jgi:hypothetical protein
MKPPRAKVRLSTAEELENVVVVNRHTYSGPKDNTYFYIGRGTPLGNQWSNLPNTAALYRVETPQQAVSKYNDWLAAQIEKGEGAVFQALQQLKALAVRGDQLKLACSCTPELCHGDIVKASIELLVHNDRAPEQQLQREPLQIISPQVPERVVAPQLSVRNKLTLKSTPARSLMTSLRFTTFPKEPRDPNMRVV